MLKQCIAACLLVSILSLPVYASTSELALDGEITVQGMIIRPKSTTQLNVIIPTKSTFTITDDRQFVAPNYVVTNNTPEKSVYIKVKSIKAADTNACKVVASDTYTDTEWKALSQDQTLSSIAFGIKTDKEYWLNSEDKESNTLVGIIEPSKSLESSLLAKYGFNWGNDADLNLKYNLTLEVGIQ